MFKTKSDVPVLMGEPFLPIVQLFEPQVPLVSKTLTSSPTDGDAGKFIVIGLAVVLAKI